MPSKHNNKEPVMDRRDFLKKAAVPCALGLGFGVWAYAFHSQEPVLKEIDKIYTFADYRVPESGVYPKMAIVNGKDAEQMVRAAVDKLGGMSRFVTPGQRVLLKPNVGWDRQPEQAANTNPDVVQAVVKLCLEAKASAVWVTDVSINDPYRSFARSGIEEAVERAGAKVKFTDSNDFVLTDLKGKMLKVWPVSRFYHQVDRVINIPVVKSHSLSKCTISMKNWYGVLGGQRNRLHQAIDVSIADLASAIRPTLTVVDATRVLKHNGPTGGSLSDVSQENTVAAGLDEVALDAYCLKFLDLTPDKAGFLTEGQQRGIGVVDWKSLKPAELSL